MAGARLGLARPGLGVVPLLLRGGQPLFRGPLGPGNLCLRGFSGGRGLLLGGGLRRQRLGQPRIGLQRRRACLRGIGFGVFGAGPGSPITISG